MSIELGFSRLSVGISCRRYFFHIVGFSSAKIKDFSFLLLIQKGLACLVLLRFTLNFPLF